MMRIFPNSVTLLEVYGVGKTFFFITTRIGPNLKFLEKLSPSYIVINPVIQIKLRLNGKPCLLSALNLM